MSTEFYLKITILQFSATYKMLAAVFIILQKSLTDNLDADMLGVFWSQKLA